MSDPGALFLVGVGAALAAFLLRGAAVRGAFRDRARLADADLLARLAAPPRAAEAVARALLVAAGSAALALGLLAGRRDMPAEGAEANRETVLVLDASNSMLARDVEPSRLERQREIARQLAARLAGRVGVVYFAGRGYVLSPLTRDREAVLMYVSAVDPSVVGQGGTSLATGLRQGLDVLAGGESRAPQAIILLTDGESTTEAVALQSVADRAAREHVRIYTIGLGTREGARIPLPPGPSAETGSDGGRAETPRRGSGVERYLRDDRGRVVVSRLQEAVRREISRATGGVHVPGTDTGLTVLLRRLEGGREGTGSRDAGAPANVLLLAAFVLLATESYLFRRG